MTVLTFDEQLTPQVSITQNFQETYKCEEFVPVVDKNVDPTWQKMVDNERFALSKGTPPMFVVAYIHTYSFLKYLRALIYIVKSNEVTAYILSTIFFS